MLLGAISKELDIIVDFTAFKEFTSYENIIKVLFIK